MPESRDQDEHRAEPRHGYVHFAWYKRIDSSEKDGEEGVARSCDVSEGGVGMITSRPLPAGARLFIELICRDGRVAAIGTVAHADEAGNGCYRIGIRMEIFSPSAQLVWAQLVKE
jgi:hypothetical protein